MNFLINVIMKKLHVKVLLMAGIIAFSANVLADPVTTPTEEKKVELGNDNDNGINNETLQVPVIATLTNNVLNVQFTGTVPVATVSVTNNLTGATISQQSMTALQGSICTVPVTSGFYNVAITNQLSGESVSGNFEVEE